MINSLGHSFFSIFWNLNARTEGDGIFFMMLGFIKGKIKTYSDRQLPEELSYLSYVKVLLQYMFT